MGCMKQLNDHVARVAQGDEQFDFRENADERRDQKGHRRVFINDRRPAERLAKKQFSGTEIIRPPEPEQSPGGGFKNGKDGGLVRYPVEQRQIGSSWNIRSPPTEMMSGCASSTCSNRVVPERG